MLIQSNKQRCSLLFDDEDHCECLAAYSPDLIDTLYYAADYLARAFVLMGSPVVQAQVNWQRSAADRAGDRQVRERLRLKLDEPS